MVFDKNKAKKILGNKLQSVNIKIVNPTEEMKEFEALRDFGAKVVNGRGEPSIIIEKGDVSITYMATPSNMEFDPFLRTLKRLSEDYYDEKFKVECKASAEILVFITPACPHCAMVVENVNKIAMINPDIKSKIIDVYLYPDLGEEYNITSAPTIIIKRADNNGGDFVKLIGEISIEELVDWLRKFLCGEDYLKEYYSTLLRKGDMEFVLKEVENSESKLIIVAKIIESGDLMAKVGAMLLLEKIYEKDPEKLKRAKEELTRIIESGNSTAIQDAIFILGKIGEKDDINILKKLLKNENEDIREAAKEAIEEIEDKIK